MELNNGVSMNTSPPQNPNSGKYSDPNEPHRFIEDFDSACSTPYVSAPSSPGRTNNNNGYFFSAPASPMHFMLSSNSSETFISSSSEHSGSFEFDFSARFPFSTSDSVSGTGSMISADELFLNGQIRPMKLSSHLQRPQVLAPLIDLEVEVEDEDEDEESKMVRGRDLRNRSLHRRARSLSPLRNSPWQEAEEDLDLDLELKKHKIPSNEDEVDETTPSVSAASSRSSSTGRSSKRWEFLKDFLRSKSEGRGYMKEKFWHSLAFSPTKEKRSSSSILREKTQTSKGNQSTSSKKSVTGKPANGVSKRRVPPSLHEIHYTAKRAQAEEMKRKTYLPYRQGLLGCLGFSSKGYGAMNGFARSLNTVSS